MSESENNFLFGKDNILFIVGGFVLTLIGFFLMIGGGSEDPNVFNEEELFSPVRISVSTILVLGGFGLVTFGIMKKKKSAK